MLSLILSCLRLLFHGLKADLFGSFGLVKSLLLENLPLDWIQVQVLRHSLVSDRLEADFLKDFLLLARFLQVVLVRVAQAAPEREGRQLVVWMSRRMRHL